MLALAGVTKWLEQQPFAPKGCGFKSQSKGHISRYLGCEFAPHLPPPKPRASPGKHIFRREFINYNNMLWKHNKINIHDFTMGGFQRRSYR